MLLADLIENFELDRIQQRWRWLMRAAGVADPDGKAPLDMQLSFLFRRRALREIVRTLIDWNPERIILAHGRWYETDGAAELRRAFRWLL